MQRGQFSDGAHTTRARYANAVQGLSSSSLLFVSPTIAFVTRQPAGRVIAKSGTRSPARPRAARPPWRHCDRVDPDQPLWRRTIATAHEQRARRRAAGNAVAQNLSARSARCSGASRFSCSVFGSSSSGSWRPSPAERRSSFRFSAPGCSWQESHRCGVPTGLVVARRALSSSGGFAVSVTRMRGALGWSWTGREGLRSRSRARRGGSTRPPEVASPRHPG